MHLSNEILPSSLELVITNPQWEGYSLWKYIKLQLPYYTKLLIIKELRLKRILVNNSSSYFQYKLQIGDTISILVLPNKDKKSSKVKPLTLKVSPKKSSFKSQIIFENENIILVSKLCNQMVQPDKTSSVNSLECLLQEYLKTDYKAKFVHRLDKPVSGLIIGAKNAKTHSLLSEAFKKREITKIYRAIVLGNCAFKTKQLKHWIDDKGKKVVIQENVLTNSKYSESKITRLANFSNFSYLEINLITGRKNQIRAQLSYISLPVLGDRKYYSENNKKILKKINNSTALSSFNPKRIALVAFKLNFPKYLVKELNLPQNSFTLPEEKNIISKVLPKN